MKVRIIGLTGSLQSGKTELAHVFSHGGFCFADLNDFANAVRQPGSPWYDEYVRLGLEDDIYDDGHKKTSYYLKVLSDPELFQAMMAIELPAVKSLFEIALFNKQPEMPVILNWGYAYKYLGQIPMEHVIVFQARKEVWLRRLLRRAERLGIRGMNTKYMLQLVANIDMEPEVILEKVRAHMDDRVTVFDTSDDDWGECQLPQVLAPLL
ncbi:MAG: dephospho-CoA kinase [Patescibacteria group bacterium]